MIEFLKGGVIKDRKNNKNDEALQDNIKTAKALSKKLTLNQVARTMKADYFTVVRWVKPEARY